MNKNKVGIFCDILEADLKARGQVVSISRFIIDPVTRFHWYLRVTELTQKNLLYKPLHLVVKFLYLSLSQRLGFSIPLNTLGEGVYIPHWGTIVVNENSFIGSGSVLNVGVVIGRHPHIKDKAPRIGEGVYIGPGAVIYGDVSIGENCVIGANAVVKNSFSKNQIIAGAPATSKGYVNV